VKFFTYTIIGIVIIGTGIFAYYYTLPPLPCTEPIYYTIGTVDQRFNMSKNKLAIDLAQASSIWNSALKKPILTYDANSSHSVDDLVVNLIYDNRQQVTSQLHSISTAVTDQKNTYSTLKAQYDMLSKQYVIDKSTLDTEINTYDQALNAYNTEVDMWNSKGGAPKDQYVLLQSEKQNLDSQLASIKADQTTFNQSVDTLNALRTQLNTTAQALNTNVATYNTIGTGISEQFNEGEYVEDNTGHHINIYQYSTENQLIRVFEHEFGHALGLSHVDDPKAVMYYLNEGTNEKLTASDIAELNTVCHKK
jgi:hypothetical protein